MIDPSTKAFCAEFGIEAVEGSAYPKLGQTRAIATVEKLRAKDEGTARLVMTTLAETRNNLACVDSISLWATYFLVRKFRAEIEADPSAWLDVWDRMPVGFLQSRAQELSGTFHQKDALGGLLYERLRRVYGQQDLLEA
jgi:hypothetical protein